MLEYSLKICYFKKYKKKEISLLIVMAKIKKGKMKKENLSNRMKHIFACVFLIGTLHLGFVSFNCTAEPIGLWHFEEENGITVNDSSGNNNTGTLINMNPLADRVDGKFGMGLQFDGDNDYIEAPDSSSLDTITSEITLIIWVKPFITAKQAMIEKWLYGLGIFERSFVFYIGADGKINFELSADGTNSNAIWLISENTLANNIWSHVAVTSDGTTVKVYINGEQDPNTKNSPPGINPSNANLHIGGWWTEDQWNDPFNGIIDEVKIYNQALSSEEILADFLRGANAISGTVRDMDNNPIQGTIVAANGYSDTTNSVGNYTILNVVSGDYIVTASKRDYRPQSKQAKVTAGMTNTLDFRLVFTGSSLGSVTLHPRVFTPNGDGINDIVTFVFENSENKLVSGKIFEISGCLIKDSLYQNSTSSLIWDGKDSNGSTVKGGVYIYQLKVGNKVSNGTIVLAK
jgi:gliding motility-associated-like protein